MTTPVFVPVRAERGCSLEHALEFCVACGKLHRGRLEEYQAAGLIEQVLHKNDDFGVYTLSFSKYFHRPLHFKYLTFKLKF
jgi:hypothetical protein